ncbi:MAG TPA: biosynthetic peptidoglycan transglycosylase, partial [Tenuifilaceae bacterium]|nr:biosynthetic peptidoglycan transglycosylase [Tenuifilaceae bacterium]
GGSTITQQLIKNLYLNQEKNIARKAEEMLMVWIIENTAAVSKDRMLEIYLNIIEWGPDVYGIAEAAGYYFNKKPNELTLQESLFLAYIVPRPTKFKYLFDDQDRLKPFLYQNFTDVASKMLMRGYITENDFQAIDSTALQLPLHGRALELIAVEPDLADSAQSVGIE